ncbi:MAG: outer membrane beta-barrel protein, partial [Saprospiraceae bacterium]|nr:outer membrane beta-barrel protein [Saprospiraceae bacterium]
VLQKYGIGLFLLLLLPLGTEAQIEDADIIFRELTALKGVWFMPQDRGDRLQIWARDNDSTLSGRELRIKEETGDTVLLETMRIELRGQVITFHQTIRGQNNNEPIPFELTLADFDGYLFENPEQVNPKKIRYRMLGNREIQVWTEGQRGSRTVTSESVFEREFTPARTAFHIRAGANYFTQRATGNFPSSADPNIPKNPITEPRVGWEVGTQFRFEGRGGFITLNLEAGLAGKFTYAKSAFTVFTDSVIDYVRDANYRQTWLILAAVPEINLKRDGRFTILAGPYYGRLLFNKISGVEQPSSGNKLFDANNDFKKNDLGIIAGFQYKWNFWKKDLGGTFGLRANLGLADLDALYNRDCDDPAFCNGRIGLQGISLYYSFNLLGL